VSTFFSLLPEKNEKNFRGENFRHQIRSNRVVIFFRQKNQFVGWFQQGLTHTFAHLILREKNGFGPTLFGFSFLQSGT
jgi:hypothetical protein